MTYLERFLLALYLSEGWYVWYSERNNIPVGMKNHGRARAVVLFDRVMTDRSTGVSRGLKL